jgi:hypothetical protein
MTLTLSQQEFDLMQDALLEYSRSLRDQARPHCAGYSATGMDLCAKRLAIEALVDGLRRTAPVGPAQVRYA